MTAQSVHFILLLALAMKNSLSDSSTTNFPSGTSNFVDTDEPTTNWTIDENKLQQNKSRVNGGQPATQIVPYQVSLQRYRLGRWSHFCGGSIISADHVLTAAHCMDKLKVDNVSVVSGTLTWRKGGTRRRVVAKHIHPNFNMQAKIRNDVAIIKVKPAFQLQNRTISAVSLGNANRIGSRVPVRLTGWGLVGSTIAATTGLPEQLQELVYHTISNRECSTRGFRVSANELCALGVKGEGACMGDAGGPLVIAQDIPQLVGIVSYGTATCAQGKPDVYTRVSSYLSYINKVINDEMP